MSVALIDRTRRVRLPSGEEKEINRFDYNLAVATTLNPFVQCADGVWIRVRSLTPIERRPAP